jgi:two-component sensor histidine kinase
LIRDEHGNPAVLTGIVQDITERKQNEEKLKMLLQEKEILLAEVHHRVKNNLQIIVSLLGLQAREIGDERVRVAFEESRNRIKSMALVHEQLYRSREYAKIEFESYVDQLASTLFNMYQVEPERVRIEIDADDVYLNLENAIPCGLLLNELITNSLKYAFPNGRTGKIWITLVPEESNIVLTVGDDGIGIPAKFDFGASQSLGLQLVHLLTVHDLQGKITLERKNGTQFCIEFPVQPGKGG